MKFTLEQYLDGECTRNQYVNQFNPPKIELGKVYKQEAYSWATKHYKIIFIDGEIAVGISVFDKISNKYIGDYCLFYAKDGFKYHDTTRPNYRLREEIAEK